MTIVLVVHESGHAIAALLCGIPVHQFGLGFGPGYTITGVPLVEALHFGVVPLGAYVVIDTEVMRHASSLTRVLIAVSGMLSNVLCAGFLLIRLKDGEKTTWKKVFRYWYAGVPEIDTGGVNTKKAIIGPISITKVLALSPEPHSKVIAWLSLAVANFNLIPIIPLDGWRIVKDILELVLPRSTALVIATLSPLIIFIVFILFHCFVDWYSEFKDNAL